MAILLELKGEGYYYEEKINCKYNGYEYGFCGGGTTNAFAATINSDGTITDSTGKPISQTDGHTQFGVMTVGKTTAQAIKNVSFEVPLYVTMAVVADDENVITPSNYAIKNVSFGTVTTNSGSGGGSTTTRIEYPIVISNVDIQSFKDSTFELVSSSTTITKDEEMKLTLGGLNPSISTPGALQSFDDKTANSGLLAASSVFSVADGTNRKLKEIGYNDTLNIPIVGLVKKEAGRTDESTAAQFKVIYTVSPVVAPPNGGTGSPAPIGGVITSDTKPW